MNRLNSTQLAALLKVYAGNGIAVYFDSEHVREIDFLVNNGLISKSEKSMLDITDKGESYIEKVLTTEF